MRKTWVTVQKGKGSCGCGTHLRRYFERLGAFSAGDHRDRQEIRVSNATTYVEQLRPPRRSPLGSRSALERRWGRFAPPAGGKPGLLHRMFKGTWSHFLLD